MGDEQGVRRGRRPGQATRDTRHIVVDMKKRSIRCLFCGRRQRVDMVMSVKSFMILAKAFSDEHGTCAPAEAPITPEPGPDSPLEA